MPATMPALPARPGHNRNHLAAIPRVPEIRKPRRLRKRTTCSTSEPADVLAASVFWLAAPIREGKS